MTRILAIAALLTTIPSVASAQEWLSDRRYSEGAGVSLGSNLVLHPGIGLEGGYDSNVFYQSADDPGGPTGAGRLRVSPHLDLSTRPPQRLENGGGEPSVPNNSFRLGLAATYQEYLSSDDVVTNQRNVEVDGALRGEFNRRQAVSFTLGDDFARTTEPTNEAAFATFNRIYNRADAALKIAPGGRTLEFGVGYGFFINFFEDVEWRAPGNFLGHDLYATTRWKFFPKTAVVFDLHVTPTNYYDAASTHPSSIPIRARAGLNGLLTQRVALLAMVGYGAGFYTVGDDFDSIIGQLELGYLIGPLSRLKLGYLRDFQDSIFANYYIQDRGYLEFNQMISGRFLLGIRGGVARLGYSAVTTAGASDSNRVDVRADAGLFGEYRAKDWLGINVSLEYQGNFSDWSFTDPDGEVDQADFSKLQVFAGVRVFY